MIDKTRVHGNKGRPHDRWHAPLTIADGIIRITENLKAFDEMVDCLMPDLMEHDFDATEATLKELGRLSLILSRDSQWLKTLPEETRDQIVSAIDGSRRQEPEGGQGSE